MRKAAATSNSHLPTELGASSTEYTLLVAAIAAVVVLVTTSLGGFVQKTYEGTCDEIELVAAPVTTTCGTP